MASRLAATNIAARLGVFSNEALVDFYSRLAEDESAPEAATEKAQAMRTAYVGNDVAQRLEAMQSFWFQEGADRPDYAGYVAMERAAARLPVTAEVGDRESDVSGRRVSVRVDLGGGRIIK